MGFCPSSLSLMRGFLSTFSFFDQKAFVRLVKSMWGFSPLCAIYERAVWNPTTSENFQKGFAQVNFILSQLILTVMLIIPPSAESIPKICVTTIVKTSRDPIDISIPRKVMNTTKCRLPQIQPISGDVFYDLHKIILWLFY